MRNRGRGCEKEIFAIRPDMLIMLRTGFSYLVNEESARGVDGITKPSDQAFDKEGDRANGQRVLDG